MRSHNDPAHIPDSVAGKSPPRRLDSTNTFSGTPSLAAEPLGLDEARKLRGSGWVGDLDEMRTHRSP